MCGQPPRALLLFFCSRGLWMEIGQTAEAVRFVEICRFQQQRKHSKHKQTNQYLQFYYSWYGIAG